MSEARELSYYPIEEVKTYKRPNRNIKKTKTIKKKSNSGIKIVFLFFPVIISSICLLILLRYVNITTVRQEITYLENQKIELAKNRANLIGDIEGIKASKEVAEDAMLKLGMDYPRQDQIVYISVNESLAKEELEALHIFKKIFSIVASKF